jgi:hypothetical protein
MAVGGWADGAATDPLVDLAAGVTEDGGGGGGGGGEHVVGLLLLDQCV